AGGGLVARAHVRMIVFARRAPRPPSRGGGGGGGGGGQADVVNASIMPASPLLQFRQVDTHYGDLHVLKAVDYRIDEGEIVCLLGGNASGKSTTMKTIMGVVAPTRGEVRFRGQSLAGVSVAERVRRGIAPVLEARRLFPRMTVYENLE